MYARPPRPLSPLLVLEPGTPIFAPAPPPPPPPPPPPSTDDAQSLSASLSFSYSHVSHDSASQSTADVDHRDQQRRPVPPDMDRYQRVLRLVNDAHPLGWRVDSRHSDRDQAADNDHNSFVLRAPPPHRAARNTHRMQRIVERSNDRQPRHPRPTLPQAMSAAPRPPPRSVGRRGTPTAAETTRRS